MKPYNKSNISLAKPLRKHMTPWERKLWYEYLRYYPVRFGRQKCIGEYIVDFYCAKAQLAIELDGSGHYEPEQAAADEIRTQHLKALNVTVLRICNLDIDKNFTGVCEYIDMIVQKSLPQSATLTAPSSEGAFVPGKTIFALGFFDGVHLGHQALLSACRKLAKDACAQTGAVTFTAHPDTLVSGKTPGLINTIEDRIRLLESFGMETVISLPFDKNLMQTPWELFLEQLLEQGAAGFVCGDDFRFGFRGEGNAEKLTAFCKDRGLPCAVVPEQLLDGIRVSSTHIRQLLEQGDVASAAAFLGHPHILTGKVVKGKQLGRTIGIPTANLTLPEGLICPKKGVYATKVSVKGQAFTGVTNIGTRPTVSGEGISVETWLLGYEGDLYGEELQLQFLAFLRPEQKFSSLEELKAQIQRDAARAVDS